MKTTEKIDMYLIGKLEGKELITFEQRINDDKKFASEIKFHKEINESIIDDEAYYLRQKISLLVPNYINRNQLIKVFSSIAASIIIAVSIISISNQNSTQKAFDNFYAPYETDLNTRSVKASAYDISFAYQLYQKGEFETAYTLLENYNNSIFDNSAALFYHGVCAIELEEYAIAEEKLLKIAKDTHTPFALHAKWYLSMLYLKSEKTEKATQYLEELADSTNFYAARAKKILKKHL